MISKIIMSIAGLLSIVSAWMPWILVMGKNINGFNGRTKAGIIFVVAGALIIIMALIGKKWSAAVSILFSLGIGFFGLKYYSDATSGIAQLMSSSAGIGVYCMIAASALGIVGALIKLFSVKKEPVVTKEKFGEGFGEYTK